MFGFRSLLPDQPVRRSTFVRVSVAAIAAGVVALAPAAFGQYEQPAHELQAGTSLTLNEPPIAQSDPAYSQQPLENVFPFGCQQQPECRETDFDMRYADGTAPDAEFFTTFTVTYTDPAANIAIYLYGDPNGNANEVGTDGTGRHTLRVHMVNHPYDAIQQYGLLVFLNQGSNVAYTIQINSSTTAFPTPFESLNPSPTATTIPAPPSGPPAPAPVPPSDTTPSASVPGQTLPPPAAANPSPDTDFTLPASGFESALAAPAPSLFHKAPVPKPPGPPNDALLVVSLLILPIGAGLFLVWWQRRRRAREAV
jgi:hypothetical protein